MDEAEARSILNRRLDELRHQPYAHLRDTWLHKSDCEEFTEESGVEYQVTTQAFWDDREAEHLRVVVSIDDGGWRAFSPLTDSFIVAPDGRLVSQ